MGELPKIEDEILTLSLAEKYRLLHWLQELVRIEQLKADREVRKYVERQAGLGYTYRQEYVKCGSSACKCVTGNGHGPYWYKYWTVNGKTKKSYIGKTLTIPKSSTSDDKTS